MVPPGLRFQAASRLCSDTAVIGDTVRATVVSGGDTLNPPVLPGTRATFVIVDARAGQLADSARRPRFDLRPLALEAPGGARPFAGQVAVEYKIYAPPDSGIYYICLTPSSQLFTLP
jgi:hypothetical protein